MPIARAKCGESICEVEVVCAAGGGRQDEGCARERGKGQARDSRADRSFPGPVTGLREGREANRLRDIAYGRAGGPGWVEPHHSCVRGSFSLLLSAALRLAWLWRRSLCLS